MSSLLLTSQRRHESLHSAGSGPKNEVAVDSRGNCDGESEGAHDESSHCQVDQDVVERLPQLLVLGRDQQRQAVDGSPGADEEKHVESQKLVDNGVHHVILRVFKRTSDNPGPVGHGDVEVLALSAIRLNSSIPDHLGCSSLRCSSSSKGFLLRTSREPSDTRASEAP